MKQHISPALLQTAEQLRDRVIALRPCMPKGQVSGIFTNITKVNCLMQIADFLKVNIKIEAIYGMEELNNKRYMQ